MFRVLLFALVATPAAAAETYVYVVQDQLSLSEVSTLLYGTSKRWRQIADWNHLGSPYRIRLKQKLKLKDAPTISKKKGKKLLLAMWRKRFGLDRSGRALASQSIAKPEPPPKFEEVMTQAKSEKIWDSFEEAFNEGERLYREKDFEKALPLFQESRKINDRYLPAWLYEIRTLRFLKKEDEEKELVESFIDTFPHLKNLPILKGGA